MQTLPGNKARSDAQGHEDPEVKLRCLLLLVGKVTSTLGLHEWLKRDAKR